MSANSNIEKLETIRLRGVRADHARRAIEEPFEGLRRAYYIELVAKSRADGRIAEHVVWKMVALDDLLHDLDSDVSAGRVAEKKLAQIAENAEHGN